MRIITSDAGGQLYGKIKAFGAAYHASWRCLYINFSGHPERYNRAVRMHFVVRTIADTLSDIDGQIYVCDDDDVFILFQGAVRPIINRLGAHFEGIALDSAGGQPEDSIFTVFDLSKYWTVFFDLCKSKSTPVSGIRTIHNQRISLDDHTRSMLEIG